MCLLASTLRPFWAPGLNDIAGNVSKGLTGWLADENYLVYKEIKAKQFILNVSDPEPFLRSLAAEVNRTAVAACESIRNATRDVLLPKSTAWIVIKTYYSAFFAAHALLRMFGKGFITLDQIEVNSINKIGHLYGLSGESVSPGNFVFDFTGVTNEIHWHRVDSSSGGVHEKFWSYFRARIEELSNDLLRLKTGIAADNQQVSLRLSALVENLCFDSCAKGTWLSVVRNRVNYRHHFGAWYPYRTEQSWGTVDERLTDHWLLDPMKLDLTTHTDKNLRRFQETCSFIIGTCRVLANDMAARCAVGKSFHNYGWLAITRFAAQRKAKSTS